MTAAPDWIEQLLTATIAQGQALGVPFSDSQITILQRLLLENHAQLAANLAANLAVEFGQTTPASTSGQADALHPTAAADPGDRPNPLAELTPAQRQTLLDFWQAETSDIETWKAQLMNDWLYDTSSGQWQFIRKDYGLAWLQRLTLADVQAYVDLRDRPLQVGDRVEVSNGLWEWVQDDGPCTREWVPCVVMALRVMVNDDGTTPDSYRQSTTCVVRFAGGREFEIQGIYEWNQYQWRRSGD